MAHGLQRPKEAQQIIEMTQRDAYQLKHHLDLGKPSPGKPQSAQQSQTQVFSPAARPQVPRGDVTHCFYSNRDVINVLTLAFPTLNGGKASDWLQPTQQPKWPGADWPRLSKPAEQLVNPSRSPQTVAEVPKRPQMPVPLVGGQ